MVTQRIVICALLVSLLCFGFDLWLWNWQWWAVVVPVAVVVSLAEAIEAEIRGWY